MVAIFLALVTFIYFLIKKSRWATVALLAVFLGIISLFNFTDCSYKARNRIISSAISQTKLVMDYIYKQDGHYDNFDCTHQDVAHLCAEIDNHKGLKDNREPIIIKNAPINSQEACVYSPTAGRKEYWICEDSSEQWHSGWTNINPANSGYCVEGESAVCPPLNH